MTDEEFAWETTLEWHNMTLGRNSPMNKIRRTERLIIRLMFIATWLFLWTLGGCAPQNDAINYRTYTDPEKGIFYIYDGVLDHAELISGVGGDQTKVLITRQGN